MLVSHTCEWCLTHVTVIYSKFTIITDLVWCLVFLMETGKELNYNYNSLNENISNINHHYIRNSIRHYWYAHPFQSVLLKIYISIYIHIHCISVFCMVCCFYMWKWMMKTNTKLLWNVLLQNIIEVCPSASL